MRQIAKDNDAQWQSNTPAEKRTKRGRTSHRVMGAAFVEPMTFRKAVTELPKGDDWTFEIKFDGYRCIALKTGRKVTLYSRNLKKLNARFQALAEALAALPGDFGLDGEIVALDYKGRPSFQLLQNSGGQQAPIFFYTFDLFHRDGEDLHYTLIEERRELLNESLAAPVDPVRLSFSCCRRPLGTFSKPCISWGLKVSSESVSARNTNLASAAVHGSSIGSTARRSSSSAASSLARAASTH